MLSVVVQSDTTPDTAPTVHRCRSCRAERHSLRCRILAKARQVSVEQKKLRALMADAGVADASQVPCCTCVCKIQLISSTS